LAIPSAWYLRSFYASLPIPGTQKPLDLFNNFNFTQQNVMGRIIRCEFAFSVINRKRAPFKLDFFGSPVHQRDIAELFFITILALF
jgi:hypothetical protein